MGLWKDVRLENIPDNEPVFLLRGQDVIAPAVVRFWCDYAKYIGVNSRTIEVARNWANTMEQWKIKKVPDGHFPTPAAPWPGLPWPKLPEVFRTKYKFPVKPRASSSDGSWIVIDDDGWVIHRSHNGTEEEAVFFAHYLNHMHDTPHPVPTEWPEGLSQARLEAKRAHEWVEELKSQIPDRWGNEDSIIVGATIITLERTLFRLNRALSAAWSTRKAGENE